MISFCCPIKITRLDKRLYALRDVTGTVDSVGLITSSILGKKLSESLDGLVLDVKYGSGAFMRTYEDAEKLALSLFQVATSFGVRTEVILTDMNEPLGEWAGNGVEVMEAVKMLRGEKTEERFYNVTMSLAEAMCRLAFPHDGRDLKAELEHKIKSGEAYERFLKIISAQGASAETVAKLDEILAPAEHRLVLKSGESGYLKEIDTFALGKLLISLGAGRRVLTDPIDHKPGLRFVKRIGERVEKGEPIMEIYSSRPLGAEDVPGIFVLGNDPPDLGEYIRPLKPQAANFKE